MKKERILVPIVLIMMLSILSAFAMFSVSIDTNIAYAFENADVIYGDTLYSSEILGKSETETINYATKTVSSFSVNSTFPNCFNINNDIVNVCANVAGANIINYYDRYFDDFIPDYTPGRLRGDLYSYYSMEVNPNKKQAVIETLYSYMRTADNNGTTQALYKQGLTQYVNEKNRAIVFTSVQTNKKFDLNKFIAQIELGNPVSLYLSGFNITSISDNGETATLYKSIYETSTHIMIAYGYQKVDYYNASGKLIVSKVYLKVATGLASADGVYVVDNNGTMNDAEAVNIY